MQKKPDDYRKELDKIIPKTKDIKLPDGSKLELKPVMYGTEIQLVELFDKYTEGGGIDNFMNPVYVSNKEKAMLLLEMIVLLTGKTDDWVNKNMDRDTIVEGILRFFVKQSRSAADRIIQMFGDTIQSPNPESSEPS